MKTGDDPRLAELTAICLALPDVVRIDQGQHAAFTVCKKNFAWFLNDHHGDGIVAVCAKALPGENAALISGHPHKFYLPAYVGPRGWVGLRLDRGKIDWDEVRDLVTASYLQIAPKRLASLVGSTLG
jgi:hypothetical protein